MWRWNWKLSWSEIGYLKNDVHEKIMDNSTVGLIVSFAAKVVKTIYLRSRRGVSPTIAPYEDLNRRVSPTTTPYEDLIEQMRWGTGTAIPFRETYDRYSKMGEFVTDKEIKQGYESLTSAERIIYQVWVLEEEVDNGGFYQYFFSSAGDHALETLDTLRLIGAVNATHLLEQAIQVFGNTPFPSNREERLERMDEIPEEERGVWGDLDFEFYTPNEKIYFLVVNYLDNLD